MTTFLSKEWHFPVGKPPIPAFFVYLCTTNDPTMR